MMFFSARNFSILLLMTIFLSACKDFKVNLNPVRYPSKNKIYYRDSLYIATTIWQFIDKKVDIFEFYKRYNIPLDKVRIDVDTVIYSPDSLKLFSFVIIQSPDHEDKIVNKFYYSGADIIGYRISKQDFWKIYYFNNVTPSGTDYNKVRNFYRSYYLGLGKFKAAYDTYWDGIHNDTLNMARSITFPKENNRVEIAFGYNIDDPRFWDKSVVWEKGSRIPGYYAFETTGNVAPGYGDSLVKIIPHLDYPDSLINMYK